MISIQAKNSMMKKKIYITIIAFMFCIIIIFVGKSLKLNSIEDESTKEIVFNKILDSKNVTALESIEIEKDGKTFFLTLTENEVTVIELEPRNDSNWRMSGEYCIDNIVLHDFLEVNGLYWDTILVGDGTLLIYGICSLELGIKEIRAIVSSRDTYVYTLEDNRQLFFFDINDKNPLTITVQGINDFNSVVAEHFRSEY